MNPFALLRRAASLPGPRHFPTFKNFAYLYVSTTTQAIHLPTVLEGVGFDAGKSGYLVVKNSGPGVIHWVLSNESGVTVDADDSGSGVIGWPLFYGETEHFEADGMNTIHVMSPTEAAFWVKVGS